MISTDRNIPPDGHQLISEIQGIPSNVLVFLESRGMTHGKCIEGNLFEVSRFSEGR